MNGHEIALWSAIVAGLSYLLALGLFDLIEPARVWEYISAVAVAAITGGTVYAKQRLDDAKRLDHESPPQSPG